MVVGGSQQETLDPSFVLLGTRQQGVPVVLRELVLPGGLDLVSPSFTVRDVTTELSEPRLTCKLNKSINQFSIYILFIILIGMLHQLDLISSDLKYSLGEDIHYKCFTAIMSTYKYII
ncbi:unnamed protein product [Schistosoma curassoni]|uniref:Uncharacterized protein n=1 Tax=Schistosoma curassoni TaxID=6186 RepID=A0A183L5R0_9TREM|nr:unnamed protein product [Schistosoma curassoni]